MNYRKGFQRVYIVLAVIWCLASPGFLIFGSHFYPYGGRDNWRHVSQTERNRVAVGNEVIRHPNGTVTIIDPSYAGLSERDLCLLANGYPGPVFDESILQYAATVCDGELHTKHREDLEKTVAVACVPPFFLYLLLFQLGPWIFRGFKGGVVRA
jgi:hypothetical protein